MSRSRRGVALVTVLLLSVIMLILGLSFLYYLERDYRFAGQQEKAQQAFYLAHAGLQYARSRPDLCYPGVSGTITREVPAGDQQHYFEIQVAADGRIRSKGIVLSPLGKIIGERLLVVEPSTPVRQFRDSSR